MKKILVCNQKMFLTYDEAKDLRKKIDEIDFSNTNLIICPSYLNFDAFNGYELGSQNCFYEDKGSFTGEVSAYDLSLRGIKYSLIGHFERRGYDTDEVINLKVKAALRNSITPIICIGETKLDRELRRTSKIIKTQLFKALSNIKLEDNQEIIIAYEPAWVIGGKDTMKLNEIEDAFGYITKLLEEIGITSYKLIYGGSVTSKNISSIISDRIDGYLLGSSSVDEDELNEIVKCIK